jgi:hypothetical protein
MTEPEAPLSRVRALRWIVSGVLLGAALATALAASCTTFSGLSAAPADGGRTALPADARVEGSDGSDGGPETAPGDAAPEASGKPAYLSMQDAAKACALIFHCPLLASSIMASISVPVDRLSFSLCMSWLAGPLPPNRPGIQTQSTTLACIAKAKSCVEAGSCVSLENFEPADPRCADAGPDAAEQCADDAATVLRCAGHYALHCGAALYAPGSRCFVGADKSHWCALGTQCNVVPQCIGDLYEYCGASDLHASINCAAGGYKCGVPVGSETGLPDCLTGDVLKPCTIPGVDCTGAIVAVCDGYQQSEFDCAALGGTCSKKDGPARCVRSDDKCTPFEPTVNVCDAKGNIALCIGGAVTSFACTSVGLTCMPSAGAQSAHCG